MVHNKSAIVRVTNNFAAQADIVVNHQYSTSPADIGHFPAIASKSTSSPSQDLTVTYNTGFGHIGKDTWVVQAKVKSGPNAGQWISASKSVTLHSGDAQHVINVSVSPTNARISATTNNGSASWSAHP